MIKKILKIILPFSIAALTSLITLNTKGTTFIFSIIGSFISAFFIFKHYRLVDKAYEQPSFFNKRWDIFIAGFLTFFTAKYVLLYYSYNHSYLENIIYDIADFLSISYLKINKIFVIFILLFASISILFIFMNLIRYTFPKIKKFLKTLTKSEKIFLIIATIIMSLFAIIIYSKTTEFYYPHSKSGKIEIYDVVYTTDTGVQVNADAFKNFVAPENDIRQPLFALFSYPFGLISGILATICDLLFNNYVFFYSLFICIFQILSLNIVGILLSRMVCKKDNIWFVLLYCSTFSYFLFAFNIEQYVFGLFWLILLIYNFFINNKLNVILFLASMGSLVTNAIMLPFIIKEKKLDKYILKGIECALLFIALILIFGQLNTFLIENLHIDNYISCMGKNVELLDKVYQFTRFLSGCFIAPFGFYDTLTYDHISYQLFPTTSISILGIIIFIMCIISFVLHKNEKIIKIAFGWVLFSILILVGFGWGTAEDSLIIYAIYFSWAYLILIYKLLVKIFKEYSKYIILLLVVIMLIINIFGILDIIKFGIEYYPTNIIFKF